MYKDTFPEQPTVGQVHKDTEAFLSDQFKHMFSNPKKDKEKNKPAYHGTFYYNESTLFTRIVAFVIIVAFLTYLLFF